MIDPWVQELRRRRVLRGAGAYVIVAWVVVQGVWANVDSSAVRSLTLWLAVAGLPLSMLFSWVFQVTHEHGVQLEHPKGSHPPKSAAGKALDAAVAWGLVVVAAATIWLWTKPASVEAQPEVTRSEASPSRLFMTDD